MRSDQPNSVSPPPMQKPVGGVSSAAWMAGLPENDWGEHDRNGQHFHGEIRVTFCTEALRAEGEGRGGGVPFAPFDRPKSKEGE